MLSRFVSIDYAGKSQIYWSVAVARIGQGWYTRFQNYVNNPTGSTFLEALTGCKGINQWQSENLQRPYSSDLKNNQDRLQHINLLKLRNIIVPS